MTEQFGPGAARLAGLAGQMLGWRPAEFWAATPAELMANFTTAPPGAESLTRTDLNRLMERDR